MLEKMKNISFSFYVCVISLSLMACSQNNTKKNSVSSSLTLETTSNNSLDNVEDPFVYGHRLEKSIPKLSCKKLKKEILYNDQVGKKALRIIKSHRGKPNPKFQRAFDIGAMYSAYGDKLKKEYSKRCNG